MTLKSNFEYYFNQKKGESPWRNNLIYTSMISKDQKTFCQWYHNDGVYHSGQNQVVDPALMEEKWSRELKYLLLMEKEFPELIPEILEIDSNHKKIYLKIDGVDFWQRSLDRNCCDFDQILGDWEDQMISIIKAHRSLGLWKYSMHPSSYFVVGGCLKSINYFFTYHESEDRISIKNVESHIHSDRQNELKKYIDQLNINWNEPQDFEKLNILCWNSFRTNYPKKFINDVLKII